MDAVTVRHGQEVSNAELLQRVERIEAELRRITGILAAAGGVAPDATGADAWLNWAARRDGETAQLRRELGVDPPLRHPWLRS